MNKKAHHEAGVLPYLALLSSITLVVAWFRHKIVKKLYHEI